MAPPAEEEGCVIDNLLKEIRSGTTLRPTNRKTVRRAPQLSAEELVRLKKIAATVVDTSSGLQGGERGGVKGGEGEKEEDAKPKSKGSETVTLLSESPPATTGDGSSTSAGSSDKPHPQTVSHSEKGPVVTNDKPSLGETRREGEQEEDAEPKGQESETVPLLSESPPATTGDCSTGGQSSDKPHPQTVSHSEKGPVVTSDKPSLAETGGEGEKEEGTKPKDQESRTVTFLSESLPAQTGDRSSTSAESSNKPHPSTVSHSEKPPIVTVDKTSPGGVVSNKVVESEVSQNAVNSLAKGGQDTVEKREGEAEREGEGKEGGRSEGGEGEKRESEEEIPARCLSPIERRLRACSPDREKDGQVSVTIPLAPSSHVHCIWLHSWLW